MADTLPRAGTPAAQKGSAVLKHIMLARVDSGFFTYLPYMLQFSAQYKIYQIHMLVCRTIECPYDGMPVIKMPKTVGAMHVCPYSRKTLRARSLDHCVHAHRTLALLHVDVQDMPSPGRGPWPLGSSVLRLFSVPRPLLCLVTTQFSVFQLLRLAAR